MKRADGVEGPVEIGPHRGTPACGISGQSSSHGALRAGAGDQAVEGGPGGADLRGRPFHLGPLGHIAAGGVEGAGVSGGQLRLVGARHAPYLVSAREEPLRQGAANAAAGACDHDAHLGRK